MLENSKLRYKIKKIKRVKVVKVLKAAIAHVRVVKFGKDEYENHRKTFRYVSGFQLTDLKFIT